MPEMKCPVCAGEVPRALLRSKTFPCPTCKKPLRVRDWNPLLAIPLLACGYSLTFVIAERMGLKGYGLLIVTIFLGCAASFAVGGVLGLLLAWVFCLPPRLEMDPGPGFDDGGILHIESPPRPRKGPQ
jgi:hypothetical protein